MPITVQVTGPDGATRSREWLQESLLVGSGPEAAVRVEDPAVSSAHCLLKVEGAGRLMLVDLGSDSGTLVGGEPIRAPVRLRPGQRFELGRSSVRVEWADPEATPADPEAPDGPTRLQVAAHWGGVVVGLRERSQGTITVGEGPGCDLFLPHPSLGAGLALAEASGSRATVRVPEGVPLALSGAGATLDRTALSAAGRLAGGALALGPREVLTLELGPHRLVVRRVPRPPEVPRAVLDDQDFAFARLAAAALLVFLALATAAAITPVPEWGLGSGEYVTPSRYVRLVVPPARPQELPWRRLDPARVREREPRPRRPEEPRPQARPGAPRAPGLAPPKAEADRQKVTRLLAGLLGGAPGSGVFSGGGVGQQVTDALGGLRAPGGPRDLAGLGGLGTRGAGPGGLGGVGLGLGGSSGVGGSAPGALEVGGGAAAEPVRVVPGKTTVVGGLDREVIARVIERHRSEIKFCYETALQKDPGLAGKVAVAWTIDPAGAVSEAAVSESSIESPAVERCIVDRVRRWRFPPPRGGGVVEVTFHWLFKAAGDAAPAPAGGGTP